MDNSSKKLVQFNVSPSVSLMIDEMCKHYEMAKAVLIRFAIAQLYEGSYRKSKFGYQAGVATAGRRLDKSVKKDAQADKKFAMLEMDDESLSAYLIEIGYSPADETKVDGTTVQYRVITNENGRYYSQFERNESNGYQYDRIIFTMDELFGDLKKEKKL